MFHESSVRGTDLCFSSTLHILVVALSVARIDRIKTKHAALRTNSPRDLGKHCSDTRVALDTLESLVNYYYYYYYVMPLLLFRLL